MTAMRPTDSELIAELTALKLERPGIGVQRISAVVHDLHPTWRFNMKRVRSLMKQHDISCRSLGTSPCGVASGPLGDLSSSTDEEGPAAGDEKLGGADKTDQEAGSSQDEDGPFASDDWVMV
mmetsp:Transcript_31024/g.69650  ORF Transcript_31024/g.69650 Transcript_31024/m.69650 type:complete len:122 (-) Transcript_31024:192-557(-)|eukprot:CAMPEP_0172599646 /NCGR_PEP_ID=MMETSP1068-20121228/19756_1 /TAXON_ID=35684 /ORGANISM="Pseudopedinella elastica, Strain CCMP716" /LENGTH=121 /DNA_ID=CAMNT_0013399961 /DNA_START=192 /DNA_END=557 /DNA_ORIENTATION=+